MIHSKLRNSLGTEKIKQDFSVLGRVGKSWKELVTELKFLILIWMSLFLKLTQFLIHN